MDLTRKKKPRKRAFKACVLCRLRKAKCEFASPGDVGSEPCLRCKRDGEQCQFLPTRRGGNYGNGHTARKTRELNQGARDATENQTHADQSSHVEETRDDNSQVEIQQLAEAPLCNPSDALEILARTSPSHQSDDSDYEEDEEDAGESGGAEQNGNDQAESINGNPATSSNNSVFLANGKSTAEGTDDRQDLKSINNFPLIKLGFINPTQLRTYVSIFISRHNHYLPIIPVYRLPNNDKRLGQFAIEESFLLMVIVLIVSRYEKDSSHVSCWKFVRCHLSGITYGGLPTVGIVEGLLLLSEHLPRLHHVADNNFHRVEAFMSWNLIGLAVRFSYFLGLDQKTLLRPGEVYDEQMSRERLAWTYCYVFDRQVSIRLGKAFWSRGPGLCFRTQPEADININLEAHKNFPTLARNGPDMLTKDGFNNDSVHEQNAGASIGDDSSLVLAYVELTQILTNIHDTLYPSRDRTIALVHVGEYYRMLDEFTRTLTWFRITWKDKHQWKTFPLSETVWATFYYTKLYAYSFAFQAHVQRATTKSKVRLHDVGTGETLAKLIFPRGLTGYPDAKFILEAIDSASELLKICVNDLFPQGALAFLPSRFYGYFSYAAVFLMKVVLTEAVVSGDRDKIMTLVSGAITAIRSASSKTDKQHLGVRSSRQLKKLFRALVVATGTDLAPTPSHSSPAATEQPPGDIPRGDDEFALWLDMLEFTSTTDTAGNTFSANDAPWLPEAYMQELPSLLSANIDSDMWLSSF
ncbi:hypothetical protein V8E51_009910 [Hyaloscypha variabilis]